MKLPDNAIFYVDDVCIPHNWYTVEAGVNDKLYLRTIYNSVNTDYVLTLTAQNYTGTQFKEHIDTKIRTLMFMGNPLVPTVAYSTQTLKLTLTIASQQFKVMTDTELKTISNWGGTAYDVNKLSSVNELLTNTGNVSTAGATVEFYLNLQPIRNVYMRSPNISSFNTIGCNGESSIIKRNTCVQ